MYIAMSCNHVDLYVYTACITACITDSHPGWAASQRRTIKKKYLKKEERLRWYIEVHAASQKEMCVSQTYIYIDFSVPCKQCCTNVYFRSINDLDNITSRR